MFYLRKQHQRNVLKYQVAFGYSTLKLMVIVQQQSAPEECCTEQSNIDLLQHK
jgi:translation elongation factor EF-1beta